MTRIQLEPTTGWSVIEARVLTAIVVFPLTYAVIAGAKIPYLSLDRGPPEAYRRAMTESSSFWHRVRTLGIELLAGLAL